MKAFGSSLVVGFPISPATHHAVSAVISLLSPLSRRDEQQRRRLPTARSAYMQIEESISVARKLVRRWLLGISVHALVR